VAFVGQAESAELETARPRLNPSRKARVRLLEPACLAWLGVGCTTCVERCPVEGAVRLDAGRPVFDPSVCDGCGRCAEVCPAPGRAILLMPLADAAEVS
jgi:ferredoxin-type protein NapG